MKGLSKRNIKPLIGSVIVSIVLWVMVATEKNYDYQITVPIELVRLAPQRTLYEPIPKTALIEVRGKGRSLLVIWFYDLKFSLDFPELKLSTTIDLEQYLSTLDIPGALSIEILRVIEPKSIDLKIDKLVEMKKPVVLAGEVLIEDGYTLIDYKFEPDSVEISGPYNLIRQIQNIRTTTLDLKEQKISFSERVNLVNPQPELMALREEAVDVRFTIQRLVERVLYDIPINVINVPKNLVVEPVPQRMSLRVKGGEQIVADIKSDEISTVINFAKQYKVDREDYGAEIIIPENVTWIESIPKKFKLKVKRK